MLFAPASGDDTSWGSSEQICILVVPANAEKVAAQDTTGRPNEFANFIDHSIIGREFAKPALLNAALASSRLWLFNRQAHRERVDPHHAVILYRDCEGRAILERKCQRLRVRVLTLPCS
jgi:hypothetical protein